MIDLEPFRKQMFLLLKGYDELVSDSTLDENEEDKEYMIDLGERLYLLGYTEEELPIEQGSFFQQCIAQGFRNFKRC